MEMERRTQSIPQHKKGRERERVSPTLSWDAKTKWEAENIKNSENIRKQQSIKNSIYDISYLSLYRINFLQSVVAEHQQFDELLLSFSVWIKLFLSELQASSEINMMDHHSALTRHKVHCILFCFVFLLGGHK